jgi:DNA-binding MarR family transcriptional regulator
MTTASDHVAWIQQQWRRERPDLDVRPQAVVGRIHRLAGHLTNQLTPVYAAHGLTEGEFDVLASLRRLGAPFECAPSELAGYTMVTTGAMTKRLDRLVDAGLVTRRTVPGDGRRRVVALTPAGITAIDAAFTDHIANESRLVAELDREDVIQLERILTLWLQHYEGNDSAA